MAVLLILSSCAKGDPDGLDGGDDNEEEQEAVSPFSIANKTFKQNRQSLVIKFSSNGTCSITDNVASAGGFYIVGTPTYTYKKTGTGSATLKVVYIDKLVLNSSNYSVSTNTYNYTLDFSNSDSGYSSCSIVSVMKSYMHGRITTDNIYLNSSNTFTLY